MPGKKKVDDGRPKRPQSAYFIFMNSERDAINKENPGLTFGEFGKLAGQMWKDMDDKEKQVSKKVLFYQWEPKCQLTNNSA